jgi:hypothetical protein
LADRGFDKSLYAPLFREILGVVVVEKVLDKSLYVKFGWEDED